MIRILVFVLCLGAASLPAAEWKPKYGPMAVPLSQDSRFFQSANASAHFWSIIPYYIPQKDGASCSIATLAMTLNAIRSRKRLGSEDKLILQPELQKKLEIKQEFLAKGQMNLQLLKKLLEKALPMYGLESALVGYQNIDASSEVQSRLFRSVLKTMNNSTDEYVLINFDQGVLTGDATVGHIAAVGAYDEKMDRALILDPDREWYEPYWAPVDAILKSMGTLDSSVKKNRGYVSLKITAKK